MHSSSRSTGLVLLIMILAASLLPGCQSANPNTTTQPTVMTTPATAEPTPIPTPTAIPTPEPPSTDHPVIALTFDDGPSLRDTGTLLDLLAAEDIRATFFVLGSQVDSGRKELIAREAAEGHEIANHTYSHLSLKGADRQTVKDELTKTNDILEQITGKRPTLLRPPLGAFDDTTKAVSLELGMSIVSWSWQSCPEDWNHRGEPDLITNFVIENAANGYIILLHDTNSTTVEAMPAMIKGLKERGFRFMTVSELLATKGEGEPAPGAVYYQLKN